MTLGPMQRDDERQRGDEVEMATRLRNLELVVQSLRRRIEELEVARDAARDRIYALERER